MATLLGGGADLACRAHRMRDGLERRRLVVAEYPAESEGALPDGPRPRQPVDQPSDVLSLLRGEPLTRPARIALITGAGRRIGLEIAPAVARARCQVVLAARTLAPVEAVAEAARGFGVEALPLAFDVTDAEAITTVLGEARTKLGPIDVLINNAGIAQSAPFARTDPDLWDRHLRVN